LGSFGLTLVAPRPALSLQASPRESGNTVDRARIQIQVHSSEADAVLAIVARQAAVEATSIP
jgi:hypothetical protein